MTKYGLFFSLAVLLVPGVSCSTEESRESRRSESPPPAAGDAVPDEEPAAAPPSPPPAPSPASKPAAKPKPTPTPTPVPQPQGVPAKPLLFPAEKPAELCGAAGFAYVHKAYVYEHCGGCHYTGSVFPIPFGDKDLAVAYEAFLGLDREKVLASVVKNQFCGEDCQLTEGHPFLAELRVWLDHWEDGDCVTPR